MGLVVVERVSAPSVTVTSTPPMGLPSGVETVPPTWPAVCPSWMVPIEVTLPVTGGTAFDAPLKTVPAMISCAEPTMLPRSAGTNLSVNAPVESVSAVK